VIDCLHILQSADRRFTSVYRIVEGIVRHADAKGYRISVLFLEDGSLRAEMESQGVACDVVHWKGNTVECGIRLWKWIRNHPAHIAHIHMGGRKIPFLVRASGISHVVQHVHSPIIESGLYLVPEAAFRSADAVVACSKSVASSFHGPKTRVIYAGIDSGVVPLLFPPADAVFRVGVLSRLVPLKKIEAVIQAIARLEAEGIEIEADICGEGPSETALRNLVDQLGISNRVKFLGWCTDVRGLMGKWHLLAMPSFYEGFPIAVLEAMAAGRAVVASNVGGLPELIEDGVTGVLIPVGNTDALVESIRELSLNRNRLLNMGRNGWERVNAHFSTRLMASQTFALYDELMSGASASLGRASS
jgi:glycosyltransferase involved in cell wall biosynthesis